MNELEKYIIKHKEDLDLYSPSEEVWSRIETTLPATQKGHRKIIRMVLASAAVASLLLGALFFLNRDQFQTDAVATEFPVMDAAYAMQISSAKEQVYHRRVQIKDMISAHPELAEKFKADLTALDITYEKLKQSLDEYENQEVLIKAMISNLQLQIQVLEDQLELLQQLKNNVDEKSDTPI